VSYSKVTVMLLRYGVLHLKTVLKVQMTNTLRLENV